MTREEKAKAYDEALERAKKLLLGNEHDKTICTYFEHVFPELKESEGETIRKALLDFFRRKSEKGFEWVEYGIPNNAILSWLKEQKEEKGHNEGQKIVEYPAKCVPEVTISDDERANEDERIRKWISDRLLANYSKEDDRVKEALVWLEKQKEQKPAEWSKDDLKMIGIAISFIEQVTSCNYILGVNKLDVIAWLKALRSGTIHKGNPHWRPSEEQMVELYKTAQESPIIKENGNYLYDLYDDLIKLM